MFRIIRTRTLTARAAELDTLRQQATQAQDAATRALPAPLRPRRLPTTRPSCAPSSSR
ncbi:hypothetical protein [Streptomyces diastaticus]